MTTVKASIDYDKLPFANSVSLTPRGVVPDPNSVNVGPSIVRYRADADMTIHIPHVLHTNSFDVKAGENFTVFRDGLGDEGAKVIKTPVGLEDSVARDYTRKDGQEININAVPVNELSVTRASRFTRALARGKAQLSYALARD